MKNKYMSRMINGAYANNENIIAYCHNKTHRGYLSKRFVKVHNCIAKKCPFFEKANTAYWDTVEKKEKKKQNYILKKKLDKEKISERDKLIRETLESCEHVHVTVIREVEENFLVISYIYDKKVDLKPEILFLRKKLGMTIKLQARVGDDYVIDRLIREPQKKKKQHGCAEIVE